MSPMNWRGSFTCAALLAWRLQAAGAEFDPHYEAAELHGADHTAAALLGVDRHPRQVHEAGGKRFVVDGSVMEVLSDKEPPRRIASTDGRMLRLLGTTGTIALFAGENTKEELTSGAFYLRAEIRRLDLAAAEWLPNWRFHHDWFEGRRGTAVLMVMIDDATGRIFARFFENESWGSSATMLRSYAARHGLPRALWSIGGKAGGCASAGDG